MSWLWLAVVGVLVGGGKCGPPSSLRAEKLEETEQTGADEEGAKFIFIVSDPASHQDVAEVLASVPERERKAEEGAEQSKGKVLASGQEEKKQEGGGELGAGALVLTVLGSVVAVCALVALMLFVVVPRVRGEGAGKEEAEARPSSGSGPRETRASSFAFSLASLRRHQKKLDYRRERDGGTAAMAAAADEGATEGTAETTRTSLSERKGPTTPTSLEVRTARGKGLTGLSNPSSDLTTNDTHGQFAPSTTNCPYNTSVCPFVASSATYYTRSTHAATHDTTTHPATHDATTQLISAQHN